MSTADLFTDAGVARRPVPPDVLAAIHAELRVGKMQTADLVALRQLLTKYSEDQPRDDAGRWTSGGDSAPVIDRRALLAWVGMDSSDIRRALAEPKSVTNPRMTQAAHELVKAVVHGTRAPTLYRGLRIPKDGSADRKFKAEVQPGKRLDLNLSSWTTSRAIAAEFATSHYDQIAVQFVTENARGLSVEAAGGPAGEAEWITNGRFLVESVAPWDPTEGGRVPEGGVGGVGLTVTLTQEAVFTPPELVGTKLVKYSEDEPRDERGRWTGGSAPEWDWNSGIGRWSSGVPVADALERWVGSRSEVRAIREAAAGTQPYYAHDASGQLTPGRQQDVIDATAIARGIVVNGEPAPELYRGLRVDGSAKEQLLSLKPGDKLDLNISSWSADDQHALFFTRLGEPGDAYARVLLNLAPGAQGLRADDYTRYVSGENEWLTDGRFQVNSVKWDTSDSVDPFLVVKVSQQAVFTPPQLVGTKGA